LAATKRIPKEFLGAFKAGHRLASKDFIDEEFSRELLKKTMRGCEESRRALEYLTKFNNEYHRGIVKKGDVSAFHAKDQTRKDCYQRNNRQNADVFTKTMIVLCPTAESVEGLTSSSRIGDRLINKNGRTPKRFVDF
jgi:hypothetical protein